LPPPTEEFNYFEDINNNICIIKFFPIIKDETFASFFRDSIKAVIIETYGPGNIPSNRPKIIEILKNATDRGVVVVNVSQCRKGLSTNTYECGGLLDSVGVIFAGDMTVECALAKLSYLLGKNYEIPKIKTLFQENMRGEVTVAHKENFSFHSDMFIDALLQMIGSEKKSEESLIIANTLFPTVINELVEKGNIKMLKKLRKTIKTIHFRDYTKRNPLHVAAINGHYDITKFLLNCRININEVDDAKFTPLNYACVNKQNNIALLLKENGGILNQSNDMGTLFCTYAYEGDLDTIKLFYECGANLMMCDYDKRTLAHIAAVEGKMDIIKFLVEETNFNIMVEDRWGNTPYVDAPYDIKTLIESRYRVDKCSKKKKKMKKHALIKFKENSY